MSDTVVAENIAAPSDIAYDYYSVLADSLDPDFPFVEPTPTEDFVVSVNVTNYAGHSKQVIKYILTQILKNGNPDHDTYFTVTGIERA